MLGMNDTLHDTTPPTRSRRTPDWGSFTPGLSERLESRDFYRWASIHEPAFLVFHEKVWPRKECGKHLRFTTVQRGASANAETTPRRRNNIAHNCVMYHHHYHYTTFLAKIQ